MATGNSLALCATRTMCKMPPRVRPAIQPSQKTGTLSGHVRHNRLKNARQLCDEIRYSRTTVPKKRDTSPVVMGQSGTDCAVSGTPLTTVGQGASYPKQARRNAETFRLMPNGECPHTFGRNSLEREKTMNTKQDEMKFFAQDLIGHLKTAIENLEAYRAEQLRDFEDFAAQAAEFINSSPETSRLWTKRANEARSRADVVARGLDEAHQAMRLMNADVEFQMRLMKDR